MSKETKAVATKKEETLLQTFGEIYELEIGNYATKKEKLSYLSWADVVMLVSTKIDPNWSYEFEKFDNGNGRLVPYLYDDTGYLVFTKVTINGVTKEMCLPVMENHGNRNFAKKKDAYKVKAKNYDIEIGACDMFDINKTLMRCLVKNVAMFGLGLKIYQGEEVKEEAKEELKQAEENNKPINEKQIATLKKQAEELGFNEEKLSKGLQNSFKKKELKDLTVGEARALYEYFNNIKLTKQKEQAEKEAQENGNANVEEGNVEMPDDANAETE